MEEIWLKSYPSGVPAEINPDQYQSLVDMLEQSCGLYSQNPAFYSMGTTITFQQWLDKSRDFAAYLQNELNLQKGDRIALMLPNILQYPVAMLGALKAGLIIVNVNPLYTAPELIHQLNDAGADTILVLENFAATVAKALPDTQLKTIIITRIGDMLPFFKAEMIDFVLRYIRRKIPSWHIPHAIFYQQALKKGASMPFAAVPVTGDDLAFLQYTGGTTGVSKGAMLSHRNLMANAAQAEVWFKGVFQPGQEIVITALPLYHIFSLLANCLFLSKIGGFNILIANPRDIPTLIKTMSKFKFSIITGVNTLFNALLNNSAFVRLDFSRLKVNLGGGMAVLQAVAEKWQQVTGASILEAYGLTEASPAVAVNPPKQQAYNGAVGLPLPSTTVCLLDDDGIEVPALQSGELAIKGPQVMQGYWRNPAETAKVFTKEGWLLTGDVASVDSNGFVRILERKKDMILVSGFMCTRMKLKMFLVKIPGVMEAAVIGVPDKNSHEAVKAIVVSADPALTAESLIQACRVSLTPYKIPKYVEFVKELPKSNVGKVLRRVLRDMAPLQS